MELWPHITQLKSAFRDLVAPRYRPELYYMRGPGPAYARRMGMLEGTRQRFQAIDPTNVR
ncbi:hypothetical protein SAZ10_03115 [Mesorhizobium sp. BAC0120]|uniref:hypothetical protein n=1 Tax=Mesorhizobium sp. BAC0120 TaxID=3090670 RepID=UPI00298CACC7|nr:hypothetical protein [Mesorhizobium sp. BAC0120]MDW6020746.1 hypothetical protein [Mesorhizobium sp. BAC0120]